MGKVHGIDVENEISVKARGAIARDVLQLVHDNSERLAALLRLIGGDDINDT